MLLNILLIVLFLYIFPTSKSTRPLVRDEENMLTTVIPLGRLRP